MTQLQITIFESMIPELYIITQLWKMGKSDTFEFIRRGIEEKFPEIAEKYRLNDTARATNLLLWAEYVNGARAAAIKMGDEYISRPVLKSERPYMQAELDFICANKENMWEWLQSRPHQFHYRNHKRDKKGKLVSVEAYLK